MAWVGLVTDASVLSSVSPCLLCKLFFSYFKELVGKEVTVELKNDLAIRGTLHSVDQYLNIKLENTRVVDQDKYPHMVGHHPTLIACHCEGKGWKFWGGSNLKSKFLGQASRQHKLIRFDETSPLRPDQRHLENSEYEKANMEKLSRVSFRTMAGNLDGFSGATKPGHLERSQRHDD
ncbi:hypothetical protein ABZP36_027190 [Zizania latifolia]